MKRTNSLPSVLALVMLLAAAPAAHGQKTAPTFPVDLAVPVAPTPFKANGKTHLVYELHVTSFRAGDLLLSRVEVFDDGAAAAAPLASYEDKELDNNLARPARARAGLGRAL